MQLQGGRAAPLEQAWQSLLASEAPGAALGRGAGSDPPVGASYVAGPRDLEGKRVQSPGSELNGL